MSYKYNLTYIVPVLIKELIVEAGNIKHTSVPKITYIAFIDGIKFTPQEVKIRVREA